jgi:predicted Zn-dependent peptidase
VTEQAQKTVLENGIRVLSERMDGLRSVSVGVLVDVGPKDELPAERGYAHLVEHMLFQGTGERDAGAIAEMMEIGGGAMGAFTARAGSSGRYVMQQHFARRGARPPAFGDLK